MTQPPNRTFPITESPRRVKLTLGYRGTHFAGWARQPGPQTKGRATVQGVLERALASLLGAPTPVTAAGRTDAGVHAERQVVSFDTARAIPAAGIARALPRYLPDDVWVVAAEDVPPTFDARRSALRRWYRYHLWTHAEPMPGLWRGRCLAHPEPLDLAAMRAASVQLLGRIDAAALVTHWGRDARPERSTWRTISMAEWIEPTGPDLPLVFEIAANAFLRQMVRNIVGSLLKVGEGAWSVDDFGRAIATGDRRRTAPPAPAHGLTLWTIEYPPSADASA